MLDLRLPVGLFFLIVGAILLVDGLLHPITTPGVNLVLNRDWGACLLVFSAVMTFFGARAQRVINAEETSPGPSSRGGKD